MRDNQHQAMLPPACLFGQESDCTAQARLTTGQNLLQKFRD
jgi:hypothetical protein